jgi:TIR domain
MSSEQQHLWDVFISHAWEDKDAFVRPLAHALEALGASVWYDEFALKVGDSLSGSIDKGIAKSRYGVVVISPFFMAKRWPEYELRGLVTREIEGRQAILPIWHGVEKADVASFSPTLADKVAIRTEAIATADIARQILKVIRPDLYEKHQRAELERHHFGRALNVRNMWVQMPDLKNSRIHINIDLFNGNVEDIYLQGINGRISVIRSEKPGSKTNVGNLITPSFFEMKRNHIPAHDEFSFTLTQELPEKLAEALSNWDENVEYVLDFENLNIIVQSTTNSEKLARLPLWDASVLSKHSGKISTCRQVKLGPGRQMRGLTQFADVHTPPTELGADEKQREPRLVPARLAIARALDDLFAEGVGQRNALIPPIQAFNHEFEQQKLNEWDSRVLAQLDDNYVAMREKSAFRTLDRFTPEFQKVEGKSPQQAHLEAIWNEKLNRLKVIIRKVGS